MKMNKAFLKNIYQVLLTIIKGDLNKHIMFIFHIIPIKKKSAECFRGTCQIFSCLQERIKSPNNHDSFYQVLRHIRKSQQ